MPIKCLTQPSPPSLLSCLVPLFPLLLMTVLNLTISTSSASPTYVLIYFPCHCAGSDCFVPWTIVIGTKLVSLSPTSPIFSMSHSAPSQSLEWSMLFPAPKPSGLWPDMHFKSIFAAISLPLSSVNPRVQVISHCVLYLTFSQFFPSPLKCSSYALFLSIYILVPCLKLNSVG